MRVGTPGFVGARLREAREVRGLTAVALAEIVDVSPQSISQYENNHSSPGSEVLERIATAVNLPPHFFLMPVAERASATIFYRSMSSATKGARARAERRFHWLHDIVNYIEQYVSLPPGNIPELNLPADPLLLSGNDIETAAEDVRTYWGLREGPIANMVLLLENHGAIIARDKLFADKLDSLSQFVGDRPYILLGTDKGSAARWRFDAAHELGHIILHSRVRPEVLARPENFKQIETQAHRFAAAFLLPLASFGNDIFAVNLDSLVAIKPKWKTSIGMMIFRARHAGLISEEAERRLWINYTRRGWRRNEPFDDALEVEEPRVLRRAFELILEQSGQTPDDIVTALGLAAGDVEALCGLPSRHLSDFAPLLQMKPRSSDPSDHGGSTSPAEVIRMPFQKRQD